MPQTLVKQPIVEIYKFYASVLPSVKYDLKALDNLNSSKFEMLDKMW